MNQHIVLFDYFAKIFISAKLMISKPIGLTLLVPTVGIALLSNTQKGLLILILLFILDFITGIYASWCEKKKAEKTNPTIKEQSLISSEKLRLSGVKLFTYSSSTLSVFGIEKLFIIKSFKFENISSQNLTLTVCVIGFFCAIEFYSVFFENFKRAGFDIVEKTNTIIDKIKGTKDKITNI